MLYSNNPIIKARFEAYGIKKYWEQGYKGQGIKVAIIDEFGINHGNQMVSQKDYIAPECELFKLEMGQNSYYAIIDRIYDAIKLGVNIISISRSAEIDTVPMHNAIKECVKNNILVFCSAGNDGDNFQDYVDIKKYPAYYPETISVLAIDNSFNFSSFSSHNTMGTICGFGQNILVKNIDGQEQLVSGTSPTTIDCALVTALHWQKVVKETGKHPTYDYMMNFIKTNVVDLNEIGKDNFTGYGFFTLDKSEFERVKLMMLDSNANGNSDRVDKIHALVTQGTSLEVAEKQVNPEYFIVGYEILNGVKVPVYGGRKQ